jgi:carbonic anhydrase
MSEHRKFKAVLVACQDGRLGKTNAEWLQKLREGGEVDTILVAGGIQELVFWYDGNLILRFIAWFLGLFGIYVSSVIRGLEVSVRLHGIREIYFQQHEDCGAVGGSSAFDGESEELEYHRDLMVRAEQIVLRRFSDPGLVLLVRFKYARKLHGESWTIIGLNTQ